MGYVRLYQPGDEVSLAPHLRAADLQELRAVTDRPVVECLRMGGERSSPSYTIIGNTGRIAAMWGVTRESHIGGRIWLLGTDELVSTSLRRQFLVDSRVYVDSLHRQYKVIYNHIDARNTVHVRWLQWMGFTFIRRVPEFGLQHRPFLEFIKLCVPH